MLKRRIIPVELLHHGRLVKSVAFGAFRDVGDPLKSSQVYSDQDADELILLNIDRGQRDPLDTARYLRAIAGKCFMPIAVGGGVRSIEDAALLFEAGADKVVVNTAAYTDPDLVAGIISRWGTQALVVSIDASRLGAGQYAVKSNCGRRDEPIGLVEHIRIMAGIGVGEILINSIDNDGAMNGYDMALIGLVRPACTAPLIACGGAGHYLHLKDAFELGVNAVACGSLFNFGDNNPLRAKSFLKNYNVPLKQI
jgi:imidazole glycerol-phosphate synthase subunit HisF